MKILLTFIAVIIATTVFWYLVACWCDATWNISEMSQDLRKGIAFCYVISLAPIIGLFIIGTQNKTP